MMWWVWSSIDYAQLRNQTLDEYTYYYGICSGEYRSCVNAWEAVNVNGSIPNCDNTFIKGPWVIWTNVGTNPGNANSGGLSRAFSVRPTGGSPIINNYQWIYNPAWQVTFSPDNSEMDFVSTTDYSSQYVTCIVTYGDQSMDTLTTFVHFVDSLAPRAAAPVKNSVSKTSGDISLYPNPASNSVTVSLPSAPLSQVAFILTDITGREVYQTTLSAGVTILTLPNLIPGLYIAKTTGSGMDYVKKLTIQ
jgi:hypothetical protein